MKKLIEITLLIFILFFHLDFETIAQDTLSPPSTAISFHNLNTTCECNEEKMTIKNELILLFHQTENKDTIQDEVVKRLKILEEISNTCESIYQNSISQSECKNIEALKEVDAELELILRVLDMSGNSH